MRIKGTAFLCGIFLIFSSMNIFSQAPVIINQPSNQGVIEGQSASFYVVVTGDTLSYQWYKDGVAIGSATDSVYITPATVLTDNGSLYSVKVTNSFGSDSSEAATLYVTASGERVTEGLQLLYNFNESDGTVVNDNSGVGSPYNLGIDNPSAATWTPNGLGVNDVAYINSDDPATKIINANTQTNEITLEVWINPAYAIQRDGGRIITLSQDNQNCNFSILQLDDGSFKVRVRTTNTSDRGEPSITTESGVAANELIHLMYTRSNSGEAKLYKDGVVIASDTIGGIFSNWNLNYRLQIANEFGDIREWLGTYYLVSVYNRALSEAEVTENYTVGVNTDQKPEIIIEPQDLGLLEGQEALFTVNALGNDPIIYQWRKNGIDIPGADSTSYAIPSVSLSDDGDIYSVILNNASGSDISRNATLFVTDTSQRVTSGQIVLYQFQEGTGDTIKDVSNYGSPLNLIINNPNAVNWKPFGLEVDSIANIISTSTASKINNAIITSSEFTFEAWIKPADLVQSPGTILAIASGTTNRNFSVNQIAASIQTWLKTSTTPAQGYGLTSPSNSVENKLFHLVFVHNTKEISKIYIDGIEVNDGYYIGNLSNWNSSYYLRIGNQSSANQLWKGLFNLISFYNRALNTDEIAHNYSIGPVGNIFIDAPSNLILQSQSAGMVEIAWNDNSDNEDGFIIERMLDGSPYSVLDSIDTDDTTYTDMNIADTTTYKYRVRAYNLLTLSDYSNEVTVTTLLSSISAPSNLVAALNPQDNTIVDLFWDDNSSNELGFIIQRAEGDSVSAINYSTIDSVEMDITTYTDSTTSDTTTYTYRIYAYNADTVSAFSNLAQITTFIFIAAPYNLSAEAQFTKVELNWNDGSNNEDGFIIERALQDSSFSVLDSVQANDTFYSDMSIADTTTYKYRVRAYNLITVSGYSNEDTVTTLLSSISAPGNLIAVLNSQDTTTVDLSWEDNSSNELGFIIQRADGDSVNATNYEIIDSVGSDITAYTDSTTSDTTTYTYKVYAYNADTVSAFSNLAQITTFIFIAAPYNLSAEAQFARVELIWSDGSNNENGFIIERALQNSSFSVLDSVQTNDTSYSDMSIADTTTYKYRVRAYNLITVSGYSNEDTVTTLLSGISAPGNLIAILNSQDTTNVDLLWDDNSSNELGFIIQRAVGDSINATVFVNIDSVAFDVTTYTDTTTSDTTTYTYRIYAYNADTVSAFSNLAEITTPLPVELTSFTANAVNGKILISWTTATETNNAGFSIERSKDNIKFVELAFIEGNGTTTNTSTYSYKDNSVLSGKYYYRLKQVDFNGSFYYLKSIEADLGIPKEYSLNQNYPNPFNPSTTIRFALPINSEVNIKLYNTLGQEVADILKNELDAGVHEINFNASELSSGIYFYRLEANGKDGSVFVETKRMVLIK